MKQSDVSFSQLMIKAQNILGSAWRCDEHIRFTLMTSAFYSFFCLVSRLSLAKILQSSTMTVSLVSGRKLIEIVRASGSQVNNL